MDIHTLLAQPAEIMVSLAHQLHPVLAPISSKWHDTCSALLNEYAPNFLPQFNAFVAENTSTHAKVLPLMNPFDVVLIIIGYLVMIFVSSTVMKFLPPFKLKFFALVHNLFLMGLSAYMMTEIIHQAVLGGYSFWGNNYDQTATGLPMARIIWVFYVSKIVEFIDTLIMALKKNFHQISFLHVYHHLTIFAIWWLVTLTAPGGEAYYSAALNSFIHVVMYGYYFFSSLGFSQVIFIKRYITMMQMTQFVTMMIQAAYDLVTGGGGYPVLPTRILFFYMITLLALFMNFFIRDAARQREKKKALRSEKEKKTN